MMKSCKRVYWLLVALFMMLTIVGIVYGWQKYYLLSLIGITFLLLQGKHLGYILGWIKYLISSARHKIVKFYHTVVIKLSDWLRNKIRKWENGEMVKAPLLLLAPEVDTEAHKEYVGRLKAAIDNPDVHNVALMGAYGSGKSSILKTFKACYPEYMYVDVSLASFSQIKPKPNDNTEDGVNKLEYCILQQLFYHVRLADIPESRFGRIERVSALNRIGITFSVLLLAISYLCLIHPKWLMDKYPGVKELLDNVYVKYIPLIILLLGFAGIVFYLVRFFKRLGLKNFGVNMSGATLEIEDRKKASVMNRYLDEIIYLFQKKKYEVVFFEDLDRFGTIAIFTKLRELNIILNQSEDIKRRIVFVYAMCDNIFTSPENRTKFFDYIIPVIPYANVSNSADLFKRKFKALGLSEERLTTDFLTDISHFVTDTRVLKNIINEFTLYHNVLDSKLDLRHLLAIILYKNLCSEDFCLLHQGKGLVYEAFASVPKLKVKKREGIQKRMMEIDSEIKQIDEEVLHDISELQSVVVANFLRQKNDHDRNIVSTEGNSISEDELYEDKNIALILQGRMGFSNNYNRMNHFVRKETLTSALGSDFNYDKRKELIENKRNGKIDKLRKERRQLESKLAYLERLQLKELVNNIQDVFSYVTNYQNLSEEQQRSYNVLGYLLKEGYIDEDYFYYISIFQEGRLTPQDNEFLLSVKFDAPKGYAFVLTEIKTILSNLRIKDYEKPAIINFYLLQYLLKNEKQYGNQCDAFINTLWMQQDLDLIYTYINEWDCIDAFINRLAHSYGLIWKDIFEDSKHTRHDKMEFLKLLFAHAELDSIRKIDESCPFSEFLNQGADWLNAFNSCNENQALNIIDTINLKIENLKEGESDSAKILIKHICESGMYQLNFNNLKFIAIQNGLNFDAPNVSIYTVIKNSNLEQLKKYISDHINEFAENVIKEQNESFVSNEEIVELLKDNNVEIETKIDLIYNKDFKVNDIAEINTELLSSLIITDKMQANINNVMVYYGINGDKFQPDLIKFMNKHVVELCDDIKGKTKIEEREKKFLPTIIKESQLYRQLSYAILDNVALENVWKEHVSDFNDSLLFYALKKKIIPIDYMNTQVANDFLSYFMKEDSVFDYSLFEKALECSNSKALKALANAKCIEKRLLHFSKIPECLTAMGKPFDKLKNVGETVKLPVDTGMKELLDALHSIKYLGTINQQGDEFSVEIRKTR